MVDNNRYKIVLVPYNIDNGTNLGSAEKEIKDDIAEWNNEDFIEKTTAKSNTWHFNLLYAPHFGGAWERLIWSAKSVLVSVQHGQTTTGGVSLNALT